MLFFLVSFLLLLLFFFIFFFFPVYLFIIFQREIDRAGFVFNNKSTTHVISERMEMERQGGKYSDHDINRIYTICIAR